MFLFLNIYTIHMLQLTSPQHLFNKQKVFQTTAAVENLSSNTKQARVVIVFESSTPELPANLKEMIDKMISACKYKPEDAVYINGTNTNYSIGRIQNQYRPETILIFGNISLGKNISCLNKNIGYELSGVKVLWAESLANLEKNANEKKVLWGALQRMLGLK